LDVAVKWRFLGHLLKGDDPDSERVYRWHIEKRTRGREPRSWKRSVEDYVTSCKGLLESMLASGYKLDHPLEYGKNGRLRAGAHRLACSFLLGLDTYYVVVPLNRTATWGENWFVRYGVSFEDLQRIKADWEWLKRKK
jgi:hypothetical protein